jgi:hypothetical protein
MKKEGMSIMIKSNLERPRRLIGVISDVYRTFSLPEDSDLARTGDPGQEVLTRASNDYLH